MVKAIRRGKSMHVVASHFNFNVLALTVAISILGQSAVVEADEAMCIDVSQEGRSAQWKSPIEDPYPKGKGFND